MHGTAGRARLALALGGAIAALVLLAGTASDAATRGVTIRNFSFSPSAITVHRGDSVTWAWRSGSTSHNVTGARFHSRTQTHGSFTVRFTHAGTFSYHCTIHPFMTGKVIVR